MVAIVVDGPQVADPDMAGFVWAAALGVVVVGVLWPCVTVLRVSVSASIGSVPSTPSSASVDPSRSQSNTVSSITTGGDTTDRAPPAPRRGP